MVQEIDVNSAHELGFTAFAVAGDGKFALTGGTDSIVRIWHMDKGSEQEPDMVMDNSAMDQEGITALAMANDFWISGNESGDVKQYSQRTSELKGYITQNPGVAIRCLALHPNGRQVAISSDEATVKLVDLEDSSKVQILKGHIAGVRSVAWHPSGALLTTSGFDGRLIIWDVVEEEPVQNKVLEGILPKITNYDSAEAHQDAAAYWHPSGQHFYVASRTHEIVAISKDTFIGISTFTDDTVFGVITALALSANGVYLASASESRISIWSTQTHRLLFHKDVQRDILIHCLAFSPTQNLLAWTDSEGVFSRWRKPIPASSPDPVKKTSAGGALGQPLHRKKSNGLFDDDEEADQIGASVKKSPTRDPWDDEPGLEDTPDDDWIVDDLGDGAVNDVSEPRRAAGNGIFREMVSVTQAQSAFQPGATPMERKRRYLAFNHIGVIEATDQDTHCIINVEFHDQSSRKGYHFSDYSKCSLASLGERGALFACDADGSHLARVTYKPYAFWASRGEWTYELPVGISVVGIAAGGTPPRDSLRSSTNRLEVVEDGGTVIIATSENHLIFLTGSGVERSVIGLDGDFVTMVAGSDWVFVVHRDGAATIDGFQNLRCSLVTFDDFCLLQNTRLPLRKGQTLKWIGVSEEGSPAMYDSSGMMYIMPRYRMPLRATWVCALNADTLSRRDGKDESYWPVGVSGSTFMCLILKGRQEYPGFPRPLVQEIVMQMPFNGSDAKQTALEEPIARESLQLSMLRDALGSRLTSDEISRRELELDKQLIQLIQHACKSDLLPRALDLTKLLHHTPSIEMAVKVAGFYHLVGLQEKMELIRVARESDDRLAVVRDKRMEWTRDAPVLPTTAPLPARSSDSMTSMHAFQEFGPPPAIHRPGLTPAILRGARLDDGSKNGSSPSISTVDEPLPSHVSDSKRKRGEDKNAQESDGASKRRAIDGDDHHAKSARLRPKTNPFSRKAPIANDSNPFTRGLDGNRSLHKSESFFEKIDAAEANLGKVNRLSNVKEKKLVASGGRQTTLFGRPPPPEKEKVPRTQKSQKSMPDATETQRTLYDTQKTMIETEDNDQEETQSAEVVNDSQDHTILDEMQLEETRWETQLETQAPVAEPSQGGDPDSIDWAPSPTTEHSGLALDRAV